MKAIFAIKLVCSLFWNSVSSPGRVRVKSLIFSKNTKKIHNRIVFLC